MGWRRGTTFALVVFTAGCGSQQLDRKVLLIGLDGVRVDVLAAASTPHLDALIAQGTFSDQARTGDPTVSGPGWSSMLTGVWPAKHGVHGNDFAGKQYDRYPDFLTRLEQLDPAYRTFAVVDWPPLGTAVSGGPLLSNLLDRLVTIDGDSLGYQMADSLSVLEASAYLRTADLDAAFVYFGDIDVVGHDTGSLSDAYREAIERTDRQVGILVAALAERPRYHREDWLILVSTDHGRTDAGGHGGTSLAERTIFYLASGPSAATGVPPTAPRIVDVAVTALTHLGVTIDPAWELDGVAVGLRRPR